MIEDLKEFVVSNTAMLDQCFRQEHFQEFLTTTFALIQGDLDWNDVPPVRQEAMIKLFAVLIAKHYLELYDHS